MRLRAAIHGATFLQASGPGPAIHGRVFGPAGDALQRIAEA